MDEMQLVYGADGCVGPGTESYQRSQIAKIETKSDVRAEIDTSAPFESVKEAVCRFGGLGYWKPSNKSFENEQAEVEEISIEKLEEQASELENDLSLKQRETLDILQELESTRAFVDDLKMELRKEVSEEDDKENHGYPNHKAKTLKFVQGFKQAQRNLTRTTNGISKIRASMEVFNKKLERERRSLEKTRERLKQNSLRMSSVEERLNQTRRKLEVGGEMEEEHGSEILKELQILNSEAEKFKQMGEAAKSEILRTVSKIERRKAKIRAGEVRLAAAAKMKDAARVNVLTNEEATEMEVLKQVKEATEEIKSTKVALEEVISSMEGAAKREEWGWEEGEKMEYYCPIAKVPVLRPTLSIGQILSRKLFLQEEMMSGMTAAEKGGFLKQKISLAQMLGKRNWDMPSCVKVELQRECDDDQKQSNRKRKKSGLVARFQFLSKQNSNNQKRKKPTLNLK